MNKNRAIIFNNEIDKKEFDILYLKNDNFFKNYESFLFYEFNEKNIYKNLLFLKKKEFKSAVIFNNRINSGFDYYEIRKREIIKINSIDINIYFLKKNRYLYNYYLLNSEKSPLIYKRCIEQNKNFKKTKEKTKDTIIIDKNLYIEDQIQFQFEKLKNLIFFKDFSKFKKYIYDNIGFYNLDKFSTIKINEDYFADFILKIKQNYFSGSGRDLVLKIVDQKEDKKYIYYYMSHNCGRFVLVKDKNRHKVSLDINFYKKKAIGTINSGQGLKKIISSFSNPKIRKKISKKNLFFIFLSFSILAIALWFTFGILYKGNYDNVIPILDAGVDTVWLYLLIANFLTSIFFSTILMLIFNVVSGAKTNFKGVILWFGAAQVRFFILELTGNHILALFFYSLYVNRIMGISKAKIGGVIGAGFIFKGIIHFSTGLIFMAIGFGYLFSFNLSAFDMQSYAYVTMGLSLAGLLFATGVSMFSGFIILNNRVHNLYVNLFIKYKMFFNKKADYFNLYNSISNKSYELRISSKSWLKRKKLLWRVGISIFFIFIFQSIETMAAYNLTVNYVNTEYIPNNWDNWIALQNLYPNLNPSDLNMDIKYNFIEFVGLRSIVKNANDFLPFISFGYVEYIINGLYEILIWQNIYQISIANNIPFDSIFAPASGFVENFSVSTTLITMFFSKYIRVIFTFIIFSYFISYEFFWKRFANKSKLNFD